MATDAFADVLGTRRGSGIPNNEPRFRDPPASDAAPVASLADFSRRVRVGAEVVVDKMDPSGQVVRRVRTTIEQADRAVFWFRLDEPERTRLGLGYPRRRADCDLAGAT